MEERSEAAGKRRRKRSRAGNSNSNLGFGALHGRIKLNDRIPMLLCACVDSRCLASAALRARAEQAWGDAQRKLTFENSRVPAHAAASHL